MAGASVRRIASMPMPLCRRIGRILVGSPITACRPSLRWVSSSALAPHAAFLVGGGDQDQRVRQFRQVEVTYRASSATAKKPFMSQVPRPYQRLSRSVSPKGSLLQRASS